MASLLGPSYIGATTVRELLGFLGSASRVSPFSILGKLYMNGVPNNTPVLVPMLVEAARFLALAVRRACGCLVLITALLLITGTHMQPHRTSWPARESVVVLCELLRQPHFALPLLFCDSGLLVSLRSVTLVSPYLIVGMPDAIGAPNSTPVLDPELVEVHTSWC